jgi:hypothetical protein
MFWDPSNDAQTHKRAACAEAQMVSFERTWQTTHMQIKSPILYYAR